VARRTILQVGNQILFLSDNGVYAAAFGDLYNLRGAGVPLSEPIKATIDRINRNYVQNSVSAYYNNRLYLAVPLDSSTTNNAMLVFNFLNSGWESLDTSQPGWDIQNLIVANVGSLGKLFAISSNGAIHIIDERTDGNDRLSVYAGISATTYPISSSVTTRQYVFSSRDRKSFKKYELHVESSDYEASNASIGAEIEDPDASVTLSTLGSRLRSSVSDSSLSIPVGAVETPLPVSEDATIRGRIGNRRGYGIQIVFTPTSGRPKLRSVAVDATVANRANSSVS
jgi:hypothetical protein